LDIYIIKGKLKEKSVIIWLYDRSQILKEKDLKMVKLKDVADIIRSKNAGPYILTFDIIFADPNVYKKIKRKKIINKELIKKLYHISDKDILDIIYFDIALAIKFNLKRPICSGGFGDRDIYGAQQHSPLLEVDVYEKPEEVN